MKKFAKRIAAMLLVLTLVMTFVVSSATAFAEAKTDLVMARREDSNNLDPVIQDGNVNIWYFTMVLESLLKVGNDGLSIECGLAESYEVKDEGLTYEFKIPTDVVFSTGEPLLMEDVIWSYERAMHTEASLWAELCLNLDYVEAKDDNIFVVHVKEASPVDLATFTLFNLTIGDKSYFEEVGEEAYSKCPIGTGPYKFGEWDLGNYLMMEKNDLYRDADSVQIETIKLTVVPDDNTRVMQLQAGDVDMIDNVPWNQMGVLASYPGVQTATPTSTEVRALNINCQTGPTADVRVRQAIAKAINKTAIIQIVFFGYAQEADSFLPPSMPYYHTPETLHTYDVEAAKALLAEAGYADGLDLKLTFVAGNVIYEQMGTIIKEQLAAAGINVEIEQLEAGTFNAKREKLELNLFFGGWTSDIPDSSQQVSYWCLPALANCVHTGWNNERAIELGYAAALEMDTEKRAEMYAELQNIYADEVSTVPIYYAPYGVAMSDKLENYVQLPTGPYRFQEMNWAE